MKSFALLALAACQTNDAPSVADGTYKVATATLPSQSADVIADAVFVDGTGSRNQLGFGIWELTSELHLPTPTISLDLQLAVDDGQVAVVVGAQRSGAVPFDARDPDVFATFGQISVALQFAGTAPVTLSLDDSTVVLDPHSVNGAFGGRVSVADLHDKLIPTVLPILGGLVARDCPLADSPPACGCATDSDGAEAIALFAGGTCAITAASFAAAPVATQFITPDAPAGLSLGMAITTVRR